MIHLAQTFSFLDCVRYGLMVPNVEIVALWWAHPGIYTGNVLSKCCSSVCNLSTGLTGHSRLAR